MWQNCGRSTNIRGMLPGTSHSAQLLCQTGNLMIMQTKAGFVKLVTGCCKQDTVDIVRDTVAYRNQIEGTNTAVRRRVSKSFRLFAIECSEAATISNMQYPSIHDYIQ